jgi:hypothetical protein
LPRAERWCETRLRRGNLLLHRSLYLHARFIV